MTLLDRFRTQSRDKHPDPTVRLAFVDELTLADRETIAAMAREDEDARVRKAAVAKLMAPGPLAAVARDDRDEGVRQQAAAMLRDIALEAFEDTGEPESLEAVEEISDARTLAQIAKAATREIVGLRALSRIEDLHLLGSVARHAALEPVRLHALDTIRARADRAELLAVAMNSDFKDTAVGAVETIVDPLELEQIVARSRNKAAVKRARAILREADEQAAGEAQEAGADAAPAQVAANPPVAEPDIETMSPSQGDPLEAQLVAPEPPADLQAHAPDAAVELASRDAEAEAREAEAKEAEAREARARESETRHVRLRELVDLGVEAVADADLASARRRMAAVAREWRELTAGIDVDYDLAARYQAIDAQYTARDQQARDEDARTRREALVRLQHLLDRVEALPARTDLSLKAGERALRDVRSALSAMPPLPTGHDAEDIARRLKGAQSALLPKVQELREADEWRRFANVSVQEQLCARMEALKTIEDPEVISRTVRELQQQWREAADVPRAQADALWRRFKTAHDEVWARCEAHFAAQAEQRAENLQKKLALCEQAEGLAGSTSWIQTAEAIKKLQAEWKAIGPVSRGREKAVWDRFRGACDRFFTRRHEDLAERKAVWAQNLAKKDALCARAEALAESTEWDAAGAEIKKLQAEWRTVGPVKKSKSEAIWNRFRSACDHFFARYAARHDTARAERVAARESLCAALEGFASAAEAPADLLSSVRALRARWQQEVAARGVDQEHARALDQRFHAALAATQARWPAAFGGTDLDPAENQRRMEGLVRRMEDLAASLSGPSGAVDQSLSPTNRLAAMLRDALAANTIGGKVDHDAKLRAAAEDARQAQSSWSRIGSVPEDVRRQLSDRFHRAVRAINERAQPVARTR